MASQDLQSSPECCNSPEYEAVLQCTQDLVKPLQHCIPSVTSACLSKGLISKDVQAYTFTNNPDSEKAGRLLACIHESIKTESTKYQAFIEVLEGETYLEGVLKKLREKFSNISAIRSRERRSTVGSSSLSQSSSFETEDMVFRRDSSASQELKDPQPHVRRGSSIDSAISENTPRSSINSFKAGAIEEGGELSSDILKESLANIRASFAALVTRIVGKLKKKDIDESAFRLYIINLFSPGDIVSHTTSIAEICECLSRHRLWDYNTYHPVEKIATMFANGDDELKGWISDYKSELAAFKATTKIATFIKECDEDDDIADPDQTIQENLARYDKRYCRKLTIKLKARVTEQTLVYIDEFWRSIADHFILQPLSVLLETIREGCMEITWYIPTPSAFQILTCIKTSKEFFQEQGISRLAVDNEILYDEGMDEAQFLAIQQEVQSKLESSLITAAKERDVFNLERLLLAKVDPDAKEMDEYEWSSLLWACEKGFGDIVELLIKYGANLDIEDATKWTGLMLSCRRGYYSIAEKLLDHGADVNKCNDESWNALMWTAQNGHTEVAKLLLERGARVDMQDKAGFTPILQASQDGHLDLVKLLVEHKEVDINQRTKVGWSAVMLAAKNGHEEVVKYLVDHGCDANYQREEDGITALHIASYKKNNSLVRYLCLNQRLKVDVQDVDGMTPLMYAAKRGNLEVVKTLIENKHADVNIKEHIFEWTALFFAMETKQNDVLEYFLRSKRVDVSQLDSPDYLGNTIFELARTWNPDAYQLILHYKETQSKRQGVHTSTPVTWRTGIKTISEEEYMILFDKKKKVQLVA